MSYSSDPLFIIVDLFCGFGGTTRGFELAQLDGIGIAKVFACVNHDPKAIKSHWLNHSDVKHFEEDIRTLDLTELIALTRFTCAQFPNAKLILWASLECTNFSKAKGGLPRDADSRTLADHLDRYIAALSPDYIKIENVVEFMSWGPLDEKGRPISRKNGEDWMRWRRHIKSLGYSDDWKELNSANFGAYTSRNRLFGVFSKEGLPIVWPEPTHAKHPSKAGMHGDLKKWMPVKEVLNFEDEGESIFTREKPLVDATLERIYAGLLKFVAKGDTSFLSKYYSGAPSGKNGSTDQPAGTLTTKDHHSMVQAAFLTKNYSGKPDGKNISVEGPAGTITTFGGSHALVQPAFLVKYNSTDKLGRYNPPSVDEPAPVVATQRTLCLAQAQFLAHYFSGGGQTSSIDVPCPTVTAMDRTALVSPAFLPIHHGKSEVRSVDEPAPTVATHDRFSVVQPEYFIDKHYGQKSQNQSIDDPAGTVMPNDKHRLVTTEPFIMPTNFSNSPKSIEEPSPTITADRHHHYLINPSWGGNPGSVDEPCCVIIARQDKAPLYFVRVEKGQVSVAVYQDDSPVMIRIKQFMAAYGLVDIKMRMLRVPELLKIQGFPESYKMVGNQADQKKFIGNSVHPLVPKAWAEAMGRRLLDLRQKVA